MNSVEETIIEAQPEVEASSTNPTQEVSTTEESPTVTVAKPTIELDENSPISLMEQLLNSPISLPGKYAYGQVIEGTVMYKDSAELLVDVGAKSEGIVPSRELQTLTSQELQDIKVGTAILVFVVQPENQEGQTVLSVDKAKLEKSWRKLEKQSEVNEVVEGDVLGYNKGGLLVSVAGVRGFVPSSQVTGLNNTSDTAKQGEMSRLVNTKLTFKILEVDREHNRLILSERLAAQEQRDAQKERLMSELEQGQLRDGVVTTICDFGAFVNIGGADGLVHLSELSWSRVSHPRELLKVGDQVKVFVLSIDDKKKKVALSIKRTLPEPWSQIATTYEVGQLLEATITQVTNFGAFARIADGVEGLIHVSELAESRVNHPNDVVKEGDAVTVRLITIDPQRKRLGLSLKQASADFDYQPPQPSEVEEREPVAV